MVSNSLRTFSIFIASWSLVLGHWRLSALRLLPFLQSLWFPIVLSVILKSHVSCSSWNLHTVFSVQHTALSIWFTSTLKLNFLVGQRKQGEKKPELKIQYYRSMVSPVSFFFCNFRTDFTEMLSVQVQWIELIGSVLFVLLHKVRLKSWVSVT